MTVSCCVVAVTAPAPDCARLLPDCAPDDVASPLQWPACWTLGIPSRCCKCVILSLPLSMLLSAYCLPSPPQVKSLIFQLLVGLDHLHTECGYMHRDLKCRRA